LARAVEPNAATTRARSADRASWLALWQEASSAAGDRVAELDRRFEAAA
jgi:hypothetical protein